MRDLTSPNYQNDPQVSKPTPATIKRLFAVSGNRCAFPECNTPLCQDTDTVTGQICHISADSKGGPRYDPTQSDDDRRSYANLILLCPRHHVIVDAETDRYTVAVLKAYKRQHTIQGPIEITPHTAAIAEALLKNYPAVEVKNNTGQVVINSPGATQINNITLKTQKTKLTVAPTPGSIASNLQMRSYVDYLIKRYQECQKADTDKTGEYKYMAIYNAIRNEFGCKWEFVSTQRFIELSLFLQRRIDRTRLGKTRKAAGHHIYHDFSEHPE